MVEERTPSILSVGGRVSPQAYPDISTRKYLSLLLGNEPLFEQLVAQLIY
jgi:hypothetical protein